MLVLQLVAWSLLWGGLVAQEVTPAPQTTVASTQNASAYPGTIPTVPPTVAPGGPCQYEWWVHHFGKGGGDHRCLGTAPAPQAQGAGTSAGSGSNLESMLPEAVVTGWENLVCLFEWGGFLCMLVIAS